MADKLVAVSVLNGEVQAGDRVAYATRSGSWMTMNIGRVVDVAERDHYWKDEKTPVLKILVVVSSDGYASDYVRTVTEFNRVVKL